MSSRLGPVRARHGLVDARVSPEDLVLVPHESRWDRSDGLGLVALLALVGGLLLYDRAPEGGTGAGARVMVVVGSVAVGLVLLGLLCLVVLAVVTVLAGLARQLTSSGRARLRDDAAAREVDRVRRDGPWQLQRRHLHLAGPVEIGWRARLRLVSSEHGEVELTTPRRHRDRLEQVASALGSP